MIIAISGPQNSGKTTLIKEFLNTFKMYKTPTISYRDALKEKGLKHSRETNEETQGFILDFMINQIKKYKDEKYVIFDRCPLDVLVYTVLAAENNLVSEEFLYNIIVKVRDSLPLLDAIFITPYDDKIKIMDNGVRDTNIEYIKKVNDVYQNLLHQYYTDFEANVFFPVKDCPGIICLENLNRRLADIKLIINENGDLYSEDTDKDLKDLILNGNTRTIKNKEMMESLIYRQESLLPKVEIEGL